MPGGKRGAGRKLCETCRIYEPHPGTAGTYRPGTAFHDTENAGST